MARVIVDREACQGTGLCVAIAADVFEIDSEGTVIAHFEEIDKEQLQAVREAVSVCPVGALSLMEH